MKLRYYIDHEFIEDSRTIDLVSTGIVCEDGRDLYIEYTGVDWSKANDWVLANVKPHLNDQKAISRGEARWKIWELIEAGEHPPEFWGYYCDYDWVALCQLYGAMTDLPEGWPMFCMDLKQLAVELGDPELPKPTFEHHALADAQWNYQVHRFLAAHQYGLEIS